MSLSNQAYAETTQWTTWQLWGLKCGRSAAPTSKMRAIQEFIYLDGEQMAGLCREFGITRKAGYKIHSRYCAAAI